MLDKRPARRSIGTLLMWAVNLPLGLALVVLLTLDYRREMEDAISAKHASLEEEAMMIYQGLSCLARNGQRESIQQYIDTVCAGMQESRSPGHHIAVRFRGEVLQAEAHHRASPEIVRAMQQAAKSSGHRSGIGDETLVVGSFAGNRAEVFVSEYTSNIRRSVRREILLHLVWAAALAVAAAGIVNVVLARMVTRPVRHLLSRVSAIAQGDYETETNGYHSREMSELSSAIHQMSETLAGNERDRRAQMERARRIQRNLLPNDVTVPGLVVAHLFQPADEVGGDFYDLIRLPDDTWLICVADVVGHGVAAAMGSAMLKGLVLNAAERHREPAKILEFANQKLPGLLPDEFITMFLARWDPGSRRLSYVSAGHEPALLLRPSGEVRDLPATGLPLGIDRSAEWETEAFELTPGKRLLLTTDGIAEACDPDGRMFGRNRLSNLIVDFAGESPEDLITAIRDVVEKHQQGRRPSDDITVLVLEATGSESCVAAANAQGEVRET